MGGQAVFERGWQSLKTRNLNMFTLIAMGTGVAWLYSIIATLAPASFPKRSGKAARLRFILKPPPSLQFWSYWARYWNSKPANRQVARYALYLIWHPKRPAGSMKTAKRKTCRWIKLKWGICCASGLVKSAAGRYCYRRQKRRG